MIRRARLALILPLLLIPLTLSGQGGAGGGQSLPTFDPGAIGGGGPRVIDLPSEVRVFMRMMQLVEDYSLLARGDSLLWQRAADALLADLGDNYAALLPPDEALAFDEQSTGNYAGIGISITLLNSAVTITEVFRGAPADLAGLQVGDRIVGVNSEMSGVDGWTVNDASSRIRGEAGTLVTVFVERDGVDRPIPHEIQRDRVHVPAARRERLFGDIGYILLDRVTRGSSAEVDQAITDLEGVKGLILDLRGNPGGYLDESLWLADLFLDRGSILVRTRSMDPGTRDVVETLSRASRTPRVRDIPIIVLVDGFSASAAEIIAGALQDHDRALVIGERTFGKGTVQSVLPLPDDYLLRITSGEWYTPQGRSLNRPRDSNGNLIEVETPDTLSYVSVSGRPLRGGGGVFPDLDVENDTLTQSEREFVVAAAEAGITLQARIQEVALQAAVVHRANGTLPDRFPQEQIDTFVASLQADGVPAERLNDEVKRYLQWRLETVFYQRMARDDRSLEVQSERDIVLATALRLLRDATSQADLFARAGAELATRETTPAADAPAGN